MADDTKLQQNRKLMEAPSGIPMMDEEFEDITDNADRVGRQGSVTLVGPAPADLDD